MKIRIKKVTALLLSCMLFFFDQRLSEETYCERSFEIKS